MNIVNTNTWAKGNVRDNAHTHNYCHYNFLQYYLNIYVVPILLLVCKHIRRILINTKLSLAKKKKKKTNHRAFGPLTEFSLHIAPRPTYQKE